MGFITRYGSFWGAIPQTSGRIFWVAPSATYTVEGRSYSASDQNDGLSPERAVLTLAAAVALTTANVGDVIVMLPGTHTEAATVTVATAGISITGLPGAASMPRTRTAGVGARNKTIVTAAASTIAITVTAADVEIAYLHFLCVSAVASISLTNTADRAYVHDCTFDAGAAVAASTSTFGILVGAGTGTTTTADDVHIRNCFFHFVGGAGGAVTASGTAIGLLIDSCTFQLGENSATAWADAILIASGTSLGTVIRDCDFLTTVAGTAITDCIDCNAATNDGATTVLRCYFVNGTGTASSAINAAATADLLSAENYVAGSTGGLLTTSAG